MPYCKLIYLSVRLVIVFILLLVLTPSAPVQAQSADAPSFRSTGCYSNLYFNEEGGDLLGFEICLILSRDGYFALYQASEGEPDAPLLVPANLEGTSLNFSLPSGNPRQGNFSAVLSKNALSGTFASTGESIILPRQVSYWQ